MSDKKADQEQLARGLHRCAQRASKYFSPLCVPDARSAQREQAAPCGGRCGGEVALDALAPQG